MKTYDTVIVGAGIAGAGLSHNLKQAGYDGRILVIDKTCPGSASAYGHRNTFKEVVDEYRLPSSHKFKGLRMGNFDQIFIELDEPFYFVDYERACKKLLESSDADFKVAHALGIKGRILRTTVGDFRYKHLIDCSGPVSFIRSRLGKKVPSKFFIGDVKVLENKVKGHGNYFYFLANDSGFVEDFYPLPDKTIQGDWKITDNLDFSVITPVPDTYLKRFIANPVIKKRDYAINPIMPVLPLVHRDIVFLGDCVGNATSTNGEGLRPVLNNSKMLANALKKNELGRYQSWWKKKYLNIYLKGLALKKDHKLRMKLFCLLSKRPDIVRRIIRNEKVKLPAEIRGKLPKYPVLKQFLHYLRLKADAAIQELL